MVFVAQGFLNKNVRGRYIPGTTDKRGNIIYVQHDGKTDPFIILDDAIKIVDTKGGAMIEEAFSLYLPDGTRFDSIRCTDDIKGWFKDIKLCANRFDLLTATIKCNNIITNILVWIINRLPDNICFNLMPLVTDGIKHYSIVTSDGKSSRLSECNTNDGLSSCIAEIRMRDAKLSSVQERKLEIIVHLECLEDATNDLLEGKDRKYALEALQKYCDLFSKTHKKEQHLEDIIDKILKKHKADKTDSMKKYLNVAAELRICRKIYFALPSDFTVYSIKYKVGERIKNSPYTGSSHL